MKQEQKFETIIESYINGNISWVKSEVKKLSKDTRKSLYQYAHNKYAKTYYVDIFFFDLI